MKGYKGFTKKDCKLVCQDVEYEIGSTYRVTPNEKIEICNIGIHYCKKVEDILNYYPADKDLVICEIEDLDENSEDKDDKTVTSKIKIIKEIDAEKYPFKYDEHGNKTYQKDSYGNEYFYEYKYDEHGNIIYKKDSDGYEWVWKYDEHGNMTYKKNPNGYEWVWKYDEHGNMTYKKNTYGYELFWK